MQNVQIKPTKPSLPNQTYQTKPNLANQAYWTKPTKRNQPKQHKITSTSHAIFLCSWDLKIDDSLVGQLTTKLLVKAVNGWVWSTFGDVWDLCIWQSSGPLFMALTEIGFWRTAVLSNNAQDCKINQKTTTIYC